MKFSQRPMLAAVVTMALTPVTAMATNGYFSHGYGIKAKGMGGAGIALPQDAIAAANNPAGMAMIGDRVDFGLDLFRPDRQAKNRATGQTFDANDDQYFYIPEFGYNQMINERQAIGVSIYGNGGLNTAYTTNPFTGQKGKAGVDLAQVFVAPTFAMKINDQNAVGISLNLAYQRFKAYGLPPNFGQLSTDPNHFTNKGYDSSTGYGFSLGWTGQLAPTVTVGAMYRSRTWMKEFSKYSGLFAENGDFDIPETYGAGIAVKATSQATVAFDVQQINYSDVKAVGNGIQPAFGQCFGGDPSSCLGGNSGPGFGWNNITVYKLGFSYRMNPNAVLRAGWNHGDQPIPASESTLNVLAPGVVEDHLTLGGTWTLKNQAELSVAYMHAFEKTVHGSNSPLGPGGNYDLTMHQDSLGVAYGWKF